MYTNFEIGPIQIGAGAEPLVIPEMGINHEGSLATAKLIVDAAARAGADLVFELPLPWCISSAERFAMGAVGLMDALGVPRHPGRECLALAVTLAWHDAGRLASLKDGIYPDVALQTGLSPAQVERALRHAINTAWRNGAIEHQHRIFGDTIDARRGKPTCGEMIAQLAEELRWEA